MTPTCNALAGKELLVVDDDPGLARALQILLEDERPFPVLKASSAGEALRCLADHPGVAAVICDEAVAADGEASLLDLLGRRYPDMPVVATGVHGPPAGHACTESRGACLFLHKPVDPAELLTVLDRLVGA